MRKPIRYFPIVVFMACQSPPPAAEQAVAEPAVYIRELGREVSSLAQAELLKNVKKAMDEGGPAYAIDYCNMHATPVTDSLARHFNCRIQRLSLKNRNENNAAVRSEEKILLNNYLESSMMEIPLRDTILNLDGKNNYYRPVFIVSTACLKCHGQLGKDISNETYSSINRHYPNDRAVNYRLGEFRGVWRISFN